MQTVSLERVASQRDVEEAGLGMLDDVRHHNVHVVPPYGLTAVLLCRKHSHRQWVARWIDCLVLSFVSYVERWID